MSNNKIENTLATDPIGKLLPKFAIPAIAGILMSALYNIVDQIFIGQGVGMLGNAATNVAFPITTICMGLTLLFGIGGASNFSLELGCGNKERAKQIVGSAFGSLAICGILLCIIILIFLKPLMIFFGATDQVLEYALSYSGITAFGIPFLMLSSGGSNLIRADRSPIYAMIAVVSGAALNTILDPLFIFTFDLGIAGAALATVLSQMVSAGFVLFYLPRFKSISLSKKDFIPKIKWIRAIAALGVAACVNQLAMSVVQIAMNNLMRHYGETSIYGSDIPLAVMGVVAKVNMVFLAIVIGVAQGAQPIIGFNYGAKNYTRVRQAFRLVLLFGVSVSVTAFLLFQIFPRAIISIFGSGDELYYRFATQYLRVFLFFTFANALQPITANFFTAIGKAQKGLLMSLTRQTLFLLPLIFILPIYLGIDGILYGGPIADGVAFLLAVGFLFFEFKGMPKEE